METGNLAWIGWVVFGIIFIIAEIFTPGFVLLWFGVGALAAGLAALLGVTNLTLQFIIFLTLSASLTAASRTILASYFVREDGSDDLKTGSDSLPGQIGVVTAASKGALGAGEVKVFGSTWTAYPLAGEKPLQLGDKVMVERVQGVSLHVRRLDALPGWQQND